MEIYMQKKTSLFLSFESFFLMDFKRAWEQHVFVWIENSKPVIVILW